MIDKEKIKKDPNFDVDKFVKSELESGESPENIKFKLKNMDVNMLNIIKREGLEEKYLMEYIINKKNQGISNEDLELDLMKNYGIDSHT